MPGVFNIGTNFPEEIKPFYYGGARWRQQCAHAKTFCLSPHLLTPYRASLWSSCVVLPLLALTWMSAVLAITDRRSALFQILFAVFDSLEGFIIVMVHCILRREVG